MTLGRLTIFCDCSLSTSLAHLSTTVLGQAFMCAAAATLSLEEASRDGKSGTAFHPFHGAPLRGPRTAPPLAGRWAALASDR